MELYLIRHADALALGESGITTDEDRPLSEKGFAQAETMARTLAKRGVELDRLFTSPLVRARQTAEILLKVWAKPELVLETCDELSIGGKSRKLSKFLLKSPGEKIGLVGHMPQLAEFAAWLIGDKKAQIALAKSGVALVTFSDFAGKGLGDLEWLVTPQWY